MKNLVISKIICIFASWNKYNMNDKNTIEELHKNELIYLVFASLISSDTLLGLDDCEDLKNANIDTESKQKYQKFINDAFEIVNRDLKNFKNKMETHSK